MIPTIVIGICTYRNPNGLAKLLASLEQLVPDARYQMRVSIVDNESTDTSQQTLKNILQNKQLDCTLILEPRSGIPFARNASVKEFLARDDEFYVFIDDDEYVPPTWLQQFYNAWLETQADILTGPIKKVLPKSLRNTQWAQLIKTDHRERNPNNTLISLAYTNNTFCHQKVLKQLGPTFHPAFLHTGGSDFYYFKRALTYGYNIVWRNDCYLFETIPQSRAKFWWQLKRSFRSGSGTSVALIMLHPTLRARFKCFRLGLRKLWHFFQGFFIGLLTLNLKKILTAAKDCAFGLGLICGVFNLNYREYLLDYR